METFKILHISDLHFGAVPYQVGLPRAIRHGRRPSLTWFNSHDANVTTQLSTFIKKLDDVSLVLVTGDVATTGLPADVQAARKFFEDLSSAGVRFVVMPGNHDRFPGELQYHLGLAPFQVSMEFDSFFGDFWHCGQGAQELATIQGKQESLSFVGADFSLQEDSRVVPSAVFSPAEWSLTHGSGEVSSRVFADLLEATDRVIKVRRRAHDPCVVWACHFLPNVGRKASLPKEYDGLPPHLLLHNDQMLIQAARDKKVKALLCGHVHNNSVFRIGGLRVSAAGSAGIFGTRFGHWAHFLEFDVSRGALRAMRIQDIRYDRDLFCWRRQRYSREV